MSRSDYDDCVDGWELIRWRGAVKSAIRGKKGQRLLAEMLAALDAMPSKELIAGELVTPEGQVCALGALGRTRHLPLQNLDPYDSAQVAKAFGVAQALICEITYVNYEGDALQFREEPSKQRWERVRSWVLENLVRRDDGEIQIDCEDEDE